MVESSAKQELKRTDTGNELRTTAPNAKDFQKKLEDILLDAQQQGKTFVDIRSGDLHKEVGSYPGPNHRMPICCNVMRKKVKYTDQILKEPPKGLGANLIIRYKLPR